MTLSKNIKVIGKDERSIWQFEAQALVIIVVAIIALKIMPDLGVLEPVRVFFGLLLCGYVGLTCVEVLKWEKSRTS